MAKKSLSLYLVLILCLGITLIGCPKTQVKTGEDTVTSRDDAAKQKGDEEKDAAKTDEERRRQEENARIKADEMRRAEEERKRAEEERRRAEEAAEAARKKTPEDKFASSLEPKKEPSGIAGAGSVKDSSLLRDVHFDFDRYDIRPSDAEILRENAAVLMKNPTVKIQIEGHCDERGTAEYNLALGERRANSVKRFLVSLGVPAERLSTISYGKENPLDPGHHEEAWAKNRRGHLTVLSK
jgi:peptidoglycan-associated lipoprotein